MSFGERRLRIPVSLDVEAIFLSIFCLVAVMEEEVEETSGPEDEPRPSVVVVVVVTSASF